MRGALPLSFLIFNPDDAISYVLYDNNLVSILIKYENKSIYIYDKNMGNGMSIKNIAQNYKGFKIEKVNTKGVGDSQQDFTYNVFDRDQENNILIFDVVNDEIQGIYLEKKDLAYLIVMSNNYYLNLAPLTNVFC